MFFLLKIGGLVVLAIIFIVIFTVGRVLFMANKVKRNFKNTMNNAGFGGQQRQQAQQPQSKKYILRIWGNMSNSRMLKKIFLSPKSRGKNNIIIM